ncbi:uncharacterized protein GGS22DRAFT_191764 [Annulohypoxylon maeteangense]|uniref:uncharacterized protein n=1 Tax=Annulohypoxylon maeteangense TaxID=1927788 RepID=UPI00200883FE|nr:uncharacterized protein GGS22DRAFT_191764 [Annulohypoxylon maeteangense]KAI0882033.1 hypothetical protein GGS22DRAFT_191764 [Annulohypoxylon maeteangense]
MTVTEIAILPSSTPGEITETLRNLYITGIAFQGEWCATNAPWLTQDRGEALFQQVEDPAVAVITAHWDSIDQHHGILATPENQKLLVDLEPHLSAATARPGHIHGLHMFPKSEDEGFVSAFAAPVLVVTVWTVRRENKTRFEEALGRVKGVLDRFVVPYRHRGGWKIEKVDGEDIEQYFIAGGLDSVEKSAAFAQAEGYDKYSQALSSLALDVETKHYQRID